MHFRCFSPELYPAMVRRTLIMLNIDRNRFHVLSEARSRDCLAVYCCEKDRKIICDGVEIFTQMGCQHDAYHLLNARKTLGLSVNCWLLRANEVSFSQYQEVGYMLWCLTRAHALVRRGIKPILDTLTRLTVKKKSCDIAKLSQSLNAATLLYPRKTRCLAWSVAFLLAALPRGVAPLSLNIGVQSQPFYSHAWVEMDGAVLCDDPALPEKLVRLFSQTWGERDV